MILFIVFKKMENLTYCVCSAVDKETLRKYVPLLNIKSSEFYFRKRKIIFFFPEEISVHISKH